MCITTKRINTTGPPIVVTTPASPEHSERPQRPDVRDVRGAKEALRSEVLAARARRSAADRTAVAAALARALDVEFGDGFRAGDAPRSAPLMAVVAVYLSGGTEPGTDPLIELLGRLLVETMAPVLTADSDLEWASLTAHTVRRGGLRDTLEPASPRLGLEAIASADLVLIPALAVDRDGHRLGRGGGSYDRALTRIRNGQLVLAVVHDDEVFDAVPNEPHDRPVDGALTPSGVLFFSTAAHG
jgi:5-formyltetrahydrofolate cyclo-ligase